MRSQRGSPRGKETNRKDEQRRVEAESVIADHGVTIDTVGKLLFAWQRTREGIGKVEASQPAQMTAAMAELVAARADMDRVVNEIVCRGAA